MNDVHSLSDEELMFRLAESRPDKYQQPLIEVLGLEASDSPFSYETARCPHCGWLVSAEHIKNLKYSYKCPRCFTASTRSFINEPANRLIGNSYS